MGPGINLSDFRIETDADQENLFSGVHITPVIIAVFDLLQGDFIGLIQFEFKDEYKAFIAGNRIDASVVGI